MGPAPAVAAVRAAVRPVLAALRRDAPGTSPQEGHARVIVACSGGADSLALAAATTFEAPRAGLGAALVTVDHGWHEGSARQAARVADLGYELGFDPVEIVRVDVGPHGGPEAAARAGRYAALDAVAAALDAPVLLGHTLDDQAETVLLGLGRGSGPRSIAGMSPRDRHYRRPLLGLRRATTAAACAALGLPVWDDPANADPTFQRARLRHEVLPLLEQVLQGGVVEALARTADLLRDDLDALDGAAATALSLINRDVWSSGQVQLPVDQLAERPRAVRTRMLRAWVAAASTARAAAPPAPLTAERTAALDALVTDWHGQGPVNLPGGVSVIRTSGTLVLYRENPSEE